MKRTFVKTTASKFIPTMLIALACVAFAPAQSKANVSAIAIEKTTENKSSVQFAGSTENALMFDINISNPNADKFTLIIQAENGEVLYSKDYTDVNFAKKIKLLKNADNSTYNFVIRSSNKALENSFEVTSAIRTVDDVVVTKK